MLQMVTKFVYFKFIHFTIKKKIIYLEINTKFDYTFSSCPCYLLLNGFNLASQEGRSSNLEK